MQAKTKTGAMAKTALMAAVLAVLAPWTLPFGPVPFSLAMFAVYLTAALLPPLRALGAVAVYTLLGCAGLPVFSGFRAGPQVLAGPTGGFIAGYFAVVLCMALVPQNKRHPLVLLAGAVCGTALCYLLGVLWYMRVTGTTFAGAFWVCVAPFAVWDVAKAAAAVALAQAINQRLGKQGYGSA